jgi:hypothetical protein
MDSKVIGISRTLAAGGEEIGREVATRLGFRFVDDEIVSHAAREAGVSPETIEKVERTPRLIDRILKYIGSAPVESAAYIPPPSQHSPAYETLIEQVIRQTAGARQRRHRRPRRKHSSCRNDRSLARAYHRLT